jgi:hypothetical protein
MCVMFRFGDDVRSDRGRPVVLGKFRALSNSL